MLKILQFLKKFLRSEGREDFFYLREEIEYQNLTDHHKVAYLSSNKNAG